MTDVQGRHERDDQEPVVGEAPPQARTLFSNRAYDIMKFIAQILLPALATFYATVGALLELPGVEKTVGVIVALDLLLGAVLGVSSRQYESSGAKYDGALVLNEEEDTHDIVLKRQAEASVEAGKPLVLEVKKV